MARLARSTTPKPAPAPEPELSLEGISHIEYGMTVEYKHPRKGSFWVKFGATITPKEGESPEDAKWRLIEFVNISVNEQIEVLGE